MVNFDFKDRYDINDLLKIMEILRSPEGCPWDAEQNHESIRNNLIEEAYEVIEAINKKDKVLLQEELGDVLLQVVFHAQMEKEAEGFDFTDVCDGVCKKLVERHPHVFGSVSVESTDDVLKNWDDIKRKSKGQKTQGSAMEKIPKEMPALMRGEKIQSKARKAGFDWEEIDGAFEALESEIRELKEAMKSGQQKDIENEMGDVLFSCVNVSRFLKVDPELALTASNEKFITRFLEVERLANEQGINMKEKSIEELDELWKQAKINLASN